MRRSIPFQSSCVMGMLFLLLLSVGTTVAQTGSQQPIPEEPTIRAAAEAVLLDLVVRSKDGKPVLDLKPEEIQVYEDGKPQKIILFRDAGEGHLMHSDLPAQPGAAQPTAAGPAEEQLSSLAMMNLVTLVFDNVAIENAALAKRAAEAFIRENAGDRTWISVFNITRRLLVHQQFTQDPELLVRAVAEATSQAPIKYYDQSDQIYAQAREAAMLGDQAEALASSASQGGGGAGAAGAAAGQAAAQAKMAEVLVAMMSLSDTIEREASSRSSLYGLLSLVQGQAALEGRKTLIYFSQGLHVPPNLEALFRSVISEANRKNVSIYSVDVRGLMARGEMERARSALESAVETSRRQQTETGRAVTWDQAKLTDAADDISRMNLQMMLNDLSVSTAGFMIANTNDVAPRIEQIGEDISYHYELAYVPDRVEYDGLFRGITVEVNRKNIEVQSRSGYFALPPTGGIPMLPYEVPMLTILGQPTLPGDLEIRSSLMRFNPGRTRSAHTLIMEMPLGQLKFSEIKPEKEKLYDAVFSMMALIKDEGGEVVEKVSQEYPVRGPVKNLKTVQKSDVVFFREIDLRPGTYTLETIAHDQAGEKFGARRSTFTVPPIQEGINISSVLVVERTEKLADQPGNKDSVQILADPDNPLEFQDIKIIPSLGEPVTKTGDNKLMLYMIVYPDPNGKPPPMLDLEFSQNGQVIGATQPQLPDRDTQGRIPFVFLLPLDYFNPGTYQVRALVRQGNSSAQDSTEFTVALP